MTDYIVIEIFERRDCMAVPKKTVRRSVIVMPSKNTAALYRMLLWEFFTEQRLEEAGVPARGNLRRMGYLWIWKIYKERGNEVMPMWAERRPKLHTVNELVSLGFRGIEAWPNVGHKTAVRIRDILAYNGITLPY